MGKVLTFENLLSCNLITLITLSPGNPKKVEG
jgi:hypothetical protein